MYTEQPINITSYVISLILINLIYVNYENYVHVQSSSEAAPTGDWGRANL